MFVFAALLLSVVVLNNAYATGTKSSKGMPDNVKSIIDKSCYGCHNDEGKNQKAKDKLNFSSYETLTNVGKIGKLKSIAETVEKGEMPPKKFLEKYPEKKLTQDEITTLNKWIKAETKELKKKN